MVPRVKAFMVLAVDLRFLAGVSELTTDGRILPVDLGNKLQHILLLSGIKRFDEGVLRLNVHVTQSLVKAMRSASGGTRRQSNDQTSLFFGPPFDMFHQPSTNPAHPVISVNHQSSNRDEPA